MAMMPHLSDGCHVRIESNVGEYNMMFWEFLRQDQREGANHEERVVLRHRGVPEKLIAVRPESIVSVSPKRAMLSPHHALEDTTAAPRPDQSAPDYLAQGCIVDIVPGALHNRTYNHMPWQFVRINRGDVERAILQNGEHVISVRRSLVRFFASPPPPSEFAQSFPGTSVSPMIVSSVESPSASIDGAPPPVLPHPAPILPPSSLSLASSSSALAVQGGSRIEGEALTRGVMHEATLGNGKDWRLNTWFPIPLLGNNSVMVKKCEDPNYKLAMFPNLADAGLEMWFRSEWGGIVVRLEDFDYPKPCPARQYWPWCCWCQKFLLPVEDHRCSKKHQKAKDYMKAFGPEMCREMILSGRYW